MGCESYEAEGATIHFTEVDGGVGCLCTFPHNDGVLYRSRLKSLALLGLAVVLLKRGAIKLSDEYLDESLAWAYIPGSLPEYWVKKILALDYVVDDEEASSEPPMGR